MSKEENIIDMLPDSIDYDARLAIAWAYQKGRAEGYAEREQDDRGRLSAGTTRTIESNTDHFDISVKKLEVNANRRVQRLQAVIALAGSLV